MTLMGIILCNGGVTTRNAIEKTGKPREGTPAIIGNHRANRKKMRQKSAPHGISGGFSDEYGYGFA